MEDVFDSSVNDYDIKKNMRLIFKFFKWFGLNPPKRNSKYYWPYNLLSLIQFLQFMVVIFVFQLLHLYSVRNHFSDFTQTIYIASSAFASTMKVFFFRIGLNKFKNLMLLLDEPEYQPKCQRQVDKIDGKMKTFKVVHKIAMTQAVMFNIMYIIYPLASEERELPLKMWLPYDFTKSPNYEWSVLMAIYTIVYNSLNALNLDCFAAGLMLLIDVQLICLKDSLQYLHEDLEKKSQEVGTISNEDFLKQKNKHLNELIDHHKRIVRFASEVQSAYGVLVFTQFVAISISLCTTMFLMSVEKPFSSNFFTYLVFQALLMTQLFTYNYYGNEVIVNSEQLLMASFNMNWIDTDLGFKKRLIIFMIRLGKPIEIYFGGIFLISLSTFMTMVKTCGSYFTVLRNMNGNK